MTGYWTVAQTVSKMEHIVRRDIEKTNHGAFLPTYARSWKVDGYDYRREYALFTGYVFFKTGARDWAGIPDIHGVYRVPANPNGSPHRVSDQEMFRMFYIHSTGACDREDAPRYTRYYNPDRKPSERRNSRKPRPGKRLRNFKSR